MKITPASSSSLYASRDLAFVAYLLCQGYELADLHTDGRRAEFVVNGAPEKIARDKKLFWNCQTAVDAQTYFNTLRRLKNQIYAS